MNRKILKDLKDHIKEIYHIDIERIPSYKQFIDELDDIVLDEYFGWHTERKVAGGYWVQQLNFDSRKTGKHMVEKIKQMETDYAILAMGEVKVLDVGCGENELKKYLKNVTGIDPYNEHADLHVSILDYIAPKEYEVVTILGSINFGDYDTIYENVKRCTSYVKPGGTMFWRCNPGITHDHPRAKMIDFFEWTHEQLQEWATEFDFEVVDMGWDHPEDADIRWGNRLYQEWKNLKTQ
jgi:hypothetical protein